MASSAQVHLPALTYSCYLQAGQPGDGMGGMPGMGGMGVMGGMMGGMPGMGGLAMPAGPPPTKVLVLENMLSIEELATDEYDEV